MKSEYQTTGNLDQDWCLIFFSFFLFFLLIHPLYPNPLVVHQRQATPHGSPEWRASRKTREFPLDFRLGLHYSSS